MPDIQQNIWQKIHKHIKENYGDNEFWNKIITPYLYKFASTEVSTREKIECIDELINHLESLYLDSQRYVIIPEELRFFLESSGETSLILGYRLTESVRSLDKIIQLREILLDYNSQPSQQHENRELYELLKTIDLIINSS